MEQVFIAVGAEAMEESAREILACYPTYRKFALYGELGAGKTTLIRNFCGILGAAVPVTSPTFALIQEYTGKEVLYHADLFRLRSVEEVWEIGIEDYLAGSEWIFIEWPDLIGDWLDTYGFLRIYIDVLPSGARQIRVREPADTSTQ